jgi:hypothetical protein
MINAFSKAGIKPLGWFKDIEKVIKKGSSKKELLK